MAKRLTYAGIVAQAMILLRVKDPQGILAAIKGIQKRKADETEPVKDAKKSK